MPTTTSTASAPLPQFPATRENALHPPAVYAQLTADRPVARSRYLDGRPVWVVTSYECARAALADERFSADSTRPGFPMLGPSAAAPQVRTFTRMDPPEHHELRKMVQGEFTTHRVEDMRLRVRELTHQLIDQMLERGRPADFIREVALPLPSLIICDLLGVPYEDHDFFEQASRKGVSNDPEEVREGMAVLMPYLGDLVSRQQAAPQDNLLGRLVTLSAQTGRLTHDQITRIARQVLTAGHETTANNLGLFVLSMLLEPELRPVALRDADSRRVAVEELLRFHSTVQIGVPRVATEDVELGGETIAAGDGVIVCVSAANRDRLRFGEDADRIDPTRDARAHVAFGFGIHQCLGQNLARVELQEAIDVIFDRLPDLRLAVPFEQLEFKTDRIVYGLIGLPVEW